MGTVGPGAEAGAPGMAKTLYHPSRRVATVPGMWESVHPVPVAVPMAANTAANTDRPIRMVATIAVAAGLMAGVNLAATVLALPIPMALPVPLAADRRVPPRRQCRAQRRRARPRRRIWPISASTSMRNSFHVIHNLIDRS